eukprot:14747434-Alexandrium_andersonii.AAC.1
MLATGLHCSTWRRPTAVHGAGAGSSRYSGGPTRTKLKGQKPSGCLILLKRRLKLPRTAYNCLSTA